MQSLVESQEVYSPVDGFIQDSGNSSVLVLR